MSPNLVFSPVWSVLQDSGGVSPVLLGIIAIVLIVLFIWLLLRWSVMEKPAAVAPQKQPEIQPTAAPAQANPVYVPMVSTPEPVTESAPTAVVVPEPEAAPALAGEAEPVKAAEVAAAPVETRVDDLEIIEGIGPKIAGVLKQAGVTTFAQLAEMEPARIAEILHTANLRLADPRSWPEQARLAAAGDQVGLQALQDRLKGGREV